MAVPDLSCGMWDLLVVARRLIVVACGLLVAACMQDLVPLPGMEPRPPALEAGVLPTGQPGEPLK